MDMAGNPTLVISHVRELADTFVAEEAMEIMLRLPDVNLIDAKVAIGENAAVNIVAGAQIGNFEVLYADLHKGLFSVKQVAAGAELAELEVKVMYIKAGEAGVPTNLDWDGCVGMVQILLQK
jgi:hypothetical protein